MKKHLVFTRLMIGVNRRDAFLLHVNLLVQTLLPSLRAQTLQDFCWVVATDVNIDDTSREILMTAVSSHSNFHVTFLDPFATGSGAADIAALSRQFLGTDRNVITTRIDDDDSVSTDFIEVVQRELHPAIGDGDRLVSCSFTSGLAVAPELGLFGTLKNDSPSVGMTLYSPNLRRKHVHSFNHRKIHGAVEEAGGRALRLDPGARAMTLSGVYFNSDSREVRVDGGSKARLERRFAPIEGNAERFAAEMARFALPADYPERVRSLRTTYPDTRSPIFLTPPPGSASPMTRLDLKNRYLALARPYIKVLQAEGSTDAERRDAAVNVHVLKQAYYLV